MKTGAEAAIGQSSLEGSSAGDRVKPPSHCRGYGPTAAADQRQHRQHVVFIQLTNAASGGVQLVGPRSVDVTATIPQNLITKVGNEQQQSRFGNENTGAP